MEKPESSDKIGEYNIHERWQPPKCKLCEKSFSQETDLNTHIANVHQGILDFTQKEKSSFECEICNYRSIAKSKLEAHISSIHEGKKPYRCEFCDHSIITIRNNEKMWYFNSHMNETSLIREFLE